MDGFSNARVERVEQLIREPSLQTREPVFRSSVVRRPGAATVNFPKAEAYFRQDCLQSVSFPGHATLASIEVSPSNFHFGREVAFPSRTWSQGPAFSASANEGCYEIEVVRFSHSLVGRGDFAEFGSSDRERRRIFPGTGGFSIPSDLDRHEHERFRPRFAPPSPA